MSASHSLYVDVADNIGRTLCRDAVWDADRCTWLGWSHEVLQTGTTQSFRSLKGDLYGGTAGIALFLLELYPFTHDPHQLRCIDGALNQALSLQEKNQTNPNASFFSGTTGLAFVLAKAARITRREFLYARSKQLLSSLRDEILDPIAIDVVTGSAGAIPALLYLASVLEAPELLELAELHGQHLIAKAVHVGDEVSWQTSRNPKEAHLNGYSHGSVGIATALLELYARTKNEDYLQTALGALRFERRQRNPEIGNWPDHRIHPSGLQSDRPNYSLAWCHGAPGIGLARLRQAQILPENVEIREDLEMALATTSSALARPWENGRANFSLCHGEAGNAELLIQAAHQLQRPKLKQLAEQVGQNGIRHILQEGRPWPCGNSGAGETPGLMLGTAGIGYFYLRLADPMKVPSILLTSPA